MDISARATSLADRPHWAIRVTSARTRREDRSSISSHPLADLGGLEASGYIIAGSLDGCRDFPRLEVPAMSKNAPSDASPLVGERDGEHVVVQPLLGRLEPGLEPMALPALGLDQHDPRRLDEQDPQVAIATLRYLAEDRAIPSRDLLGDEPQPSGEVAALGKRIPIANRSHHRAGDDRPDPRHAHQPLTTDISVGDGFDLARQGLDARIEPAPVASQVLDDVHHAWRQDIGGRGQDARQLSTQEALPLPDGDAALEKEGADLIDNAGALANQPLAHAVQRLQVELIGGLRRYELHRWPLHRLGDRLRVAEVVLLALRVGAHVLRRHQPGVVTKTLELATKMMRADAGLHADQAWRQVGEPRFHLAA